MKQFVFKIIAALLPVLVYITIFVAYEPYNYFGLKEEKTGSWTTPLARTRAYLRAPSENIILGDSRMNHFDLDYVEEITGKRFANLSTGGQGLNQTKEFYDWLSLKTPIQNLVFDVSFYQIREENKGKTLEPVFHIAEHPFDYLVTRDYVVEAYALFMEEMKKYLRNPNGEDGPGTVEEPLETVNHEAGQDEKYRKDLVDYAVTNIYPGCQPYRIGEEQMGAVIEILRDMNHKGGGVILATPPVQESIFEYVIEPLKLQGEMEQYKRMLSRYTDIYDMEWKNSFIKEQDNFTDGFHLSNNGSYRIFTDNVFGKASDLIRFIPGQTESGKEEPENR